MSTAIGSVTGDKANYVAKKRSGVTLHNFPEVRKECLAKATSQINTYQQSGKRLGAQVMGCTYAADGTVTAAGIYVATGNDPKDKWVLLKAIKGNLSDVIPL